MDAVTSGQRRDADRIAAFCEHLRNEFGAKPAIVGRAIHIDLLEPGNAEGFREMTKGGSVHLADSPTFQRVCSRMGVVASRPQDGNLEESRFAIVKVRR